MNYITLSILLVVAVAVFAVMWRQGAFLKIAAYWEETKEELKKCTWPTVEELKASTAIVLVSILLMGAFTVGIDFLFTIVIRAIV